MENIKSPFVFQTDSNEVKNTLKNENYLIEFSNNPSKDKYCIIYFSSNNIYFPNTKQTFEKTIIHKNHFEWYNTRIEKGQKHIFIRDIQKQWYLNGINKKINSGEKILEFLENETKGYKVITLGSSSGGYAAVLFGSFLDAERILSFNGQFQILDLLNSSSESLDPIVFREQYNSLVNKYFSIKNFIVSPTNVYYFFSKKSEWDQTNKKHIEDVEGIGIISFNTKNHGIPFVKSALFNVINLDNANLDRLNAKSFNPILFSMKYGGVLNTFSVLFSKIKYLLFKKEKNV